MHYSDQFFGKKKTDNQEQNRAEKKMQNVFANSGPNRLKVNIVRLLRKLQENSCGKFGSHNAQIVLLCIIKRNLMLLNTPPLLKKWRALHFNFFHNLTVILLFGGGICLLGTTGIQEVINKVSY